MWRESFTKLRDKQLCSLWPVRRIQMERYAIVTYTLIVQIQVLSECVGQLWGENVIGVRIVTDDGKHNDKKIHVIFY
jgi:hypothetical protein